MRDTLAPFVTLGDTAIARFVTPQVPCLRAFPLGVTLVTLIRRKVIEARAGRELRDTVSRSVTCHAPRRRHPRLHEPTNPRPTGAPR